MTDIARDAMLVGLQVFEMDGYYQPQISKAPHSTPAASPRKPARRRRTAVAGARA